MRPIDIDRLEGSLLSMTNRLSTTSSLLLSMSSFTLRRYWASPRMSSGFLLYETGIWSAGTFFSEEVGCSTGV